MEVKVTEGCISCGLCVGTCPEVFQFNDEGTAEAYAQPADPKEMAGAEEAAENCPVSVIVIEK